ncbi:MAG: hypothetical protein ACYSSI_01960 [Planctomycetota bacterium]|jgi:hypothetical protein
MAVDNIYVNNGIVTLTVDSNWTTAPSEGDLLTGSTSGETLLVSEDATAGQNTVTGHSTGNFDTSTPDELSSDGSMAPSSPDVTAQNYEVDGTSSKPYQGPYGLQKAIDNINPVNGTNIYVKAENNIISFPARLDLDINGGIPNENVWCNIIACGNIPSWVPMTSTNRITLDFGGQSINGIYVTHDMYRFQNFRFANVNSSYPLIFTGSGVNGLVFKGCKFDTCGRWWNGYGRGILFYDCEFAPTGGFCDSDGAAEVSVINCNMDFNNNWVNIGGRTFFSGNTIKGLAAAYILAGSHSLTFNKNTFYNTGNLFTASGPGEKTSSLVFANNILHFSNPSTGQFRVGDAYHSVVCDYNATNHASCFDGLGSNNIQSVSDLGFVDPEGCDFGLKTDSVCLNSGMRTLNSGFTSIGCWQRQQNISCLLVR